MLKFSPILLIAFLSVFSLNLLSGQDFNIQLDGSDDVTLVNNALSGQQEISINGENKILNFNNGKAKLDLDYDQSGKLFFVKSSNPKTQKLFHLSKKKNGTTRSRNIPLWLSLLPPLIAIVLALLFKEVILSLFIGIWAGAFIAGGLRIESIYYIFQSFFEVIEKYVIGALNDGGHLSVIVFSLLIGGMVAIISKNGGMAGVVASLAKYAKSERSSQFITWLLGVAIFFDDYANTLIVGNTMRSLTDKFKISREKLAYIVDSTAAPVSAIFFITTWIGAELGFIDGGLVLLENYTGPSTPYAVFLASLKYAFYPILTLIFILIIIFTNRDYGQMYKAEHRARTTGQVSPASTSDEDEPNMEDLSPVKNAPLKWYNAAIPVLTVIFMTIFGLVDTGMASSYDQLIEGGNNVNTGWGSTWSNMGAISAGDGFFAKLGTLIGNADSYIALLWASLSGVVMAIILTLSGKIMSLFDTMHWLVNGFKTMLPALIILTLAWALAIIT
ncbi:MAG: Na+/H+ antiporter NhaC family protein, partial [Bacteroidota bacterium]